jgi:amino acid adenylation domain-containing protein
MERQKIASNISLAAHQNIEEKEYWLERLSGDWQSCRFPVDTAITAEDQDEKDLTTASEFYFDIMDPLLGKIKKISNNSPHTMHMMLCAALALLLRKYTATEDIVLGTTVYKQENPDILLNKLLPIRVSLELSQSFKDVLLATRTAVLDANQYYCYPMEMLAKQLGRPYDPHGDFPLFDVTLIIDNIHDPAYLRHVGTGFDMVFSYCAKKLGCKVLYNGERYREETVARIARHFTQLLENALQDVESEALKLEVMLPEELERLLTDFNDTASDIPAGETVVSLFLRQCELAPDAPAVTFEGQSLSFARLEERSARLAGVLKNKDVGPNRIVALMMEPSLEMIVAILGIWRAGGAYLPIDSHTPQKRIVEILDDAQPALILTSRAIASTLEHIPLRGFESAEETMLLTPSRPQVEALDSLQIPDRSYINYEKYRPFIGQAVAKNSMTVQFSRGCAFHCAYCFKIWADKYVVRSADSLFEEIKLYYDMGVRRFAFVDDLPNMNLKESARLFRLIIEHKMKPHLHFPNGIRGDILTKELIDLMVEAGTATMDLALETTSPRLQKLVRKHLNLDRLYDNMSYIIEKYPHVILETQLLHGLPSETEEEALHSLEYIKSLKWLHFPYIHILNIYPNSLMARIAMENGVSEEAILRSADLAYHELPETLPFPKEFTRRYQAEFLNEYFLNKQRLLGVLPQQMKVLTEDELVQKYNSYLPMEIASIEDLLGVANIEPSELKTDYLPSDYGVVPDLDKKIKAAFPKPEPEEGAMKVLLLDLSQFFTGESHIIYDVVEPPIGLLYVMSHLQKKFPRRVVGKVAKSRIDFDSLEELKRMVLEFKPDIIGIRTLNFFKDFFHKTVSHLRQWGVNVPIISGGPYATSNYKTMLKDPNIDLAVLGEGEITFVQLIESMMEHGKRLPSYDILGKIPGLAFASSKLQARRPACSRDILLADDLLEHDPAAIADERLPKGKDLAYIIYTSGSTGTPKGVMVQHDNLANQVMGLRDRFGLDAENRYLLLTTFTFDVSLMHISLPLATGARLFLISNGIRQDPAKLWDFIAGNNINILNIVPAFMDAILEHMDRRDISLDYLFVGGDAFQRSLHRQLEATFHPRHLVNIYGPTETTINATLWDGDGSRENGILPIGRPLTNYQIYILDSNLQPLPLGAVGEICIGGRGVARGYLNRPELTAEKFVKFGGECIYRSGDLGRLRDDGTIEFKGRLDRQVKIRGFRIEPDEIREKILEHPQVCEALVLPRLDSSGDRYLTAYVVPGDDFRDERLEVQSYLKPKLPDYMVPSHFIQLEKLPLSPSGKVDMASLPAVEDVLEEQYSPPRNHLEESLVGIWSSVLAIPEDRIGIDANFFKLGGHSLKATILVSRIQKQINGKATLLDIFKEPTIRRFSKFLETCEGSKEQEIPRAPQMEVYPCSPAQRRLFVLQQMDPSSTAYHLPAAMLLPEGIDIQRLEESFARMVERHESFRTGFEMVEGRPVQRILERVEFAVAHLDGGASEEKAARSFIRPFDLARPPLLRVGVAPARDNRNLLVLDMHHIISDGLSIATFIQETLALAAGEPLPPLKLQYRDYCHWLEADGQLAAKKERKDYWLSVYSQLPDPLELPLDFPRPAIQDLKGDRYEFAIAEQTVTALKELVQNQNATLFMGLLTVFNLFLGRICDADDVVVGTPVAGRRHQDLEGIIGMFVNTLALRAAIEWEDSFLHALACVREHCIEAFERQDFPFEELVDLVAPERNTGRHPLFDVMLSLENTGIGRQMRGADSVLGTIEPLPLETVTSKFDLSLDGYEADGELRLSFEYCTALFKRSTIQRFAEIFVHLLNALVASPDRRLRDIQLASAQQQRLVTETFNDRACPLEEGMTITRSLEKQVDETPDAVAMTGGNGCPGQLHQVTYKELFKRARQWAVVLQERGVGRGGIVALVCGRSVEMITAILAILEAGAAYLPIDPALPEKRIRYMLADSGARLVLTDRPQELEGLHDEVVSFVDCRQANQTSTPPQWEPAKAEDPVYIIYTSGSTGRPKGVVVEHRHLLANAAAFAAEFSLGPLDRTLQQAAFTFDVFCEELFPTLFRGAGLVLAEEEWLKDFGLLVEGIRRHSVNVIDCTPLMLSELNRMDVPACLRTFINGGDTLKPGHIDTLLEHGTVYNTYGPTESTICATYHHCGKNQGAVIPIGHPIANYQVSILDRHGNLQPIGIPGEICVAGPGVAGGYLNRPDLTAARFKDRMYKTGDRGCWLEDGTIEFLGRMDQQVKIRGYRIELGEIESLLAGHEAVEDVVVMALEDERLGDYLCAYLAAGDQKGDDLTPATLREFLSRQLPHYMIPAYFVTLESLPLTSHGKVDKRALPAPQDNIRTGATFEAPADEIQTRLYELWSHALGIEAFSIHDNIFDLGGNSLLVVQLQRAIDDVFPAAVKVVDLFAHPTIAGIGELIHRKLSGDTGLLELSTLKLPEEWFAPEGDGREDSALDFSLGGEILEGLRQLETTTGVPVERILLGLYVYLFHQVGDNADVALTASLHRPGLFREVSVDVEEIEGVDDLFLHIDHLLNNGVGQPLETAELQRMSLRRENGRALALFGEPQSIPGFDIVLHTEVSDHKLECAFQCSSRLTLQAAETLAETYMKLLDVASRH